MNILHRSRSQRCSRTVPVIAASIVIGASAGAAGAGPASAQQATPGPVRESSEPLVVTDVVLDTVRLGENVARVRVHNPADTAALAVLDLRAVPGLWLIPNMQTQTGTTVGPGETATIEGRVAFRRLSLEATLRVTVGPGERVVRGDRERLRIARVDFRETYDVGRSSPDAFDPDDYFTTEVRGPLRVHAWKGSLAERDLSEILDRRIEAVRAIETMLGVTAPDEIRLVFYADEATKIEQMGHRGVGFAMGRTVVEVYNDSVRLDPYHELAHVVAAGAGSPPAFLSEGFAIYASERLGADALEFLGFDDAPVHAAACRLRSTDLWATPEELAGLDDIGSREDRAGAEYALAGSLVKFLADERGLDALRTLYGDVANDALPADRAAALEHAWGGPLDALETAWLREVGESCTATVAVLPSFGPASR